MLARRGSRALVEFPIGNVHIKEVCFVVASDDVAIGVDDDMCVAHARGGGCGACVEASK